MIAKTMAGLEEVLMQELSDLGAEDIQRLPRAVKFFGDKALMYKANYWCRTALRILKPIASFEVKNEQDLYDKIRTISWYKLLPVEGTLAIDTHFSNAIFRNSMFISLKAKDAIVDQFRDMFNKRPSIDIENPDLRISLHILSNICTVSLDSSGNSLHKRGYRKRTTQAPINEVLAAGLILLSGWDKKSDFIDPMCGSGTLPIEAAMIANNLPSGYYIENFGFQKWSDFDRRLWKTIKDEALVQQADYEGRIIGSDISGKAIAIAEENLKFAKLHKDIELQILPLHKQKPLSSSGVMIMNPPYGERMVVDDIIKLYQEIGNTLKQNFAGFNSWVISSDLDALKYIGLKPSKKIIVFNGPLECRFNKFEVYEGSKKAVKMNRTISPDEG